MAKPKAAQLNEKQRRFIGAYIADPNATQAAIAAGYSKKTAKQQGSRLLTNVDVAAAVAKGAQKVADEMELSAKYVLSGLKEVGERCMQRHPVMMKDGKDWVQVKDPETGEGVWEFDSSGANRSLELLGKHLALFTEKVEVEHKGLVDGRTVTPEEWAALALLRHKVRAGEPGAAGT